MTTFLTFLGIGRYETVTYFWGDKAAQPTHLFPIAATELFAPERIVVFVTPQARESDHFKALSTALGDKLKPVDIPEGRSEAELWEIFDQVAGAVGEGQTVILDITHAFRSIPLVVFTVASYLRRTKKVTVRQILYGAYEARKPDNTLPESKGLVPVFDLSPLVDLLDWTSGAEALLKRGDAELIADNMTTTHQTLRHTKKGEPARLKALGKKLKEFSQALHLSRPREVMRVAHEFLELLEGARGEFEKWAKPFVLLAEEIRRDLEPLAFAESDVLSRDNLDRQFRLVEYYLAKGLLVHLDGARLWNASIATGIKPAVYAQYADSVSVCLSKGLGAPIGSLIAGSKGLIERAHRFRKMFGGGMRQAGIIAAAGIYALDHHIERLREDHQNAQRLAMGLKRIKGVSINPDHVETNIVIFDITRRGITASQLTEAMKSEGVLIHPIDKTQVRLVTHLDVSKEDIEIALKAFEKVLSE